MIKLRKINIVLFGLIVSQFFFLVLVQIKVTYFEGEVILSKERLQHSKTILNNIVQGKELSRTLFSVAGGPYDQWGRAYSNGKEVDYHIYYLHPHSRSGLILYSENGKSLEIDLIPSASIYVKGKMGELMRDDDRRLIRRSDKELIYSQDGLESENVYKLKDYRDSNLMRQGSGIISKK